MAVPQMPRKWMWRGVEFKRESGIGFVPWIVFPHQEKDFDRHDEHAQKQGGEDRGFGHQ
jgi:hypothetical protein